MVPMNDLRYSCQVTLTNYKYFQKKKKKKKKKRMDPNTLGYRGFISWVSCYYIKTVLEDKIPTFILFL